MSVDAARADPQAQAPDRRAVLRAGRLPRRRARAGAPHGEVAKALGDPIRLQLVDVLRKHAGKVCVCELVPLFDVSQPTVSHHLKVLRDAGIVDSERQGLVGLLLRDPRRPEGAIRMAELTLPWLPLTVRASSKRASLFRVAKSDEASSVITA